MKSYGLAVAITGKTGQREVTVTSTAIAVDADVWRARREFDAAPWPDRAEHEARIHAKEILTDDKLTFKSRGVDQTDPAAMRAAFERFTGALNGAVALQRKSCADAGVEYIPAAMIIGGDSRVTYEVGDIRRVFLSHAVPERGMAPQQLSLRATFANALRDCTLRFGNYYVLSVARTEEETHCGVENKYWDLNKRLVRLTPSYDAANTREQTVRTILDSDIPALFAEVLSKHDLYKSSFAFWIGVGAIDPDYKGNPAAQAKAPVYSFMGWDVRIHDAIVAHLKAIERQHHQAEHPPMIFSREELGDLAPLPLIQGNRYIQSAALPSSPFYTDPLMAIIWDHIDGIPAFYHDEEASRQFLIRRVRGSEARIQASEVPEPA